MEKLIAGIASKVTREQRNRLSEVSKKIGITKSQLIRNLVNEYLNKNQN